MFGFVLLAHLTLSAPATAVAVVGAVDVESGGAKTVLVPFAAIPEGASIFTHENARTSLRLQSGSLIRLGPDTHILLSRLQNGTPAAARREQIKLLVGKMWAHVMGLLGQESHFEIETTNAVAGIRGTALWVQAGTGGDRFILERGALVVHQGDRTVQLDGPGASAIIGASGLVFDGYAGAYGMDGLRFAAGGPAAQLLYRTDPLIVPQLLGEAVRGQFRRDLHSPDSVADTPLAIATPADELHGLADITVRIVLPTH